MILNGWEYPAGASASEIKRWMDETQDDVRCGIVCEPRGSEAFVGALLFPSEVADFCVVYFNTESTLGMCGHGTIGVVESLRYLGKLSKPQVTLETPVGMVTATALEPSVTGSPVEIQNVKAYLYQKDASVTMKDGSTVRGDIAYGGNWFFLIEESPIPVEFANWRELTRWTTEVLNQLKSQRVTGNDGAWIDHVEVFGPPTHPRANSKNFVLCPSLAYDRSPCGTGTSAKLATLVAKGKLQIGQKWIQESITGSIFEGWIDESGLPHIVGCASVMGEGTLIFDDCDEFKWGIR